MVNFLIHISYVRWRKGHGCCGRRNRRRQVKAGLIRVVPRFRSSAASCVTAICAGIFRWKNRIWTKLSGKHGMGLKIFITCLMTRWGIWRCLDKCSMKSVKTVNGKSWNLIWDLATVSPTKEYLCRKNLTTLLVTFHSVKIAGFCTTRFLGEITFGDS